MGSRREKTQTLGLIGFGAFGQLAARTLAAHFDIRVCDPARAHATLPCGRSLRMTTLEEAAGCDVVVLAVPVARLRHLCGVIAPMLRKGALVLDVGSVKVLPVRVMREVLPDDVDIVGTHPLFGPQSAASGVQGHKIVVCPVRGDRHRQVAAFLRHLGLQVITDTADAHDRELAVVQGLTHLIAKVLVGLGPLPDRMTTASFDLLREAVDMVRDDPPTVLHAIEVSNPYAATVREAFFTGASELQQRLDM